MVKPSMINGLPAPVLPAAIKSDAAFHSYGGFSLRPQLQGARR
jgi:hypothetical protein